MIFLQVSNFQGKTMDEKEQAWDELRLIQGSWLPALVVLLYAMLCIARAPQIFAGRFWAEEGVYYAIFAHMTPLESLLYAGLGYPMLVSNALVLAARLVPI